MHAALRNAGQAGAGAMALSAVDLALHDLAGKAVGVPVYQLLGGKLRDSIPVCHSLGIMDTQAAVDEAVVAVQEGIGTVKCKTGLDPERDVDLVRRLRETLGPRVKLRVDSNEAYPTPRLAAQVTAEMEPYGILFHEQPVAGFEALAEVARLINVPVMADESAWYARDILRLYELRAADILSLYYSKPGGLYRARQVADVAAACGFTCDIGGSIEMGIGVAANLHLGVSTEILHWASVCPVPNPDGRAGVSTAGIYYLDDIIATPLRYEDGHLFVPDGPGLGVEVDEAKLERYAA
jgi:muconate cycloisomerase